MDLLELKKDLPSIEDGRWVTSKELPGLKDLRVKVRGHGSRIVRECYASKERETTEADREGSRLKKEVQDRITRETLAEATLIDIQGLTISGEVIDVERLRPLLLDPAFEPICDLLSAASFRVNSTRVSQLEELKGN